jgi:hypothetical protein
MYDIIHDDCQEGSVLLVNTPNMANIHQYVNILLFPHTTATSVSLLHPQIPVPDHTP